MNPKIQLNGSAKIDTTLLVLGLASFFFYPFTAVPGIVIAKRHAIFSPRGRLGYFLCWTALGLFCVHLLLIGGMLYYGMKP